MQCYQITFGLLIYLHNRSSCLLKIFMNLRFNSALMNTGEWVLSWFWFWHEWSLYVLNICCNDPSWMFILEILTCLWLWRALNKWYRLNSSNIFNLLTITYGTLNGLLRINYHLVTDVHVRSSSILNPLWIQTIKEKRFNFHHSFLFEKETFLPINFQTFLPFNSIKQNVLHTNDPRSVQPRLHFGDGSLSDVVLDVLVVKNVVDDLTKTWEVLKQIDFREIVQVVNDASEVNVSPGCLWISLNIIKMLISRNNSTHSV